LLGVPVSEIVDRVVPLGDLWGESGRRLAGELAGLGPDPDLNQLQAELLAHLTAQTPSDLARSELLHAATKVMTTRAGQPPKQVPAVAQRLAISERHLRSLFTDGLGISLKRFARYNDPAADGFAR
jgi:hypothetical protein